MTFLFSYERLCRSPIDERRQAREKTSDKRSRSGDIIHYHNLWDYITLLMEIMDDQRLSTGTVNSPRQQRHFNTVRQMLGLMTE